MMFCPDSDDMLNVTLYPSFQENAPRFFSFFNFQTWLFFFFRCLLTQTRHCYPLQVRSLTHGRKIANRKCDDDFVDVINNEYLFQFGRALLLYLTTLQDCTTPSAPTSSFFVSCPVSQEGRTSFAILLPHKQLGLVILPPLLSV